MEGASPELGRRHFSRARLISFFSSLRDRVEATLEEERQQLVPWAVVLFGTGIAGWFALPGSQAWVGLIVTALGLSAIGVMLGGRLGRTLWLGSLLVALGLGWTWQRSNMVAAPILAYPRVVEGEGIVLHSQPRLAEGRVRLTVKPDDPDLPPKIRITAEAPNGRIEGMDKGARIHFRARIQPPPPMALPDTHDYARDMWFMGIGAVGRSLDPPELLQASEPDLLQGMRHWLTGTIKGRLPGPSGGIAEALATGDQSGVGREQAEAMRRSGLAHLLSVSGLHIAAVVAAAMAMTLRLGALIPWLALRINLVLVAAGFGAASGIFYTILTGMQVPTVRSCIAALLVLLGLALGRQAISIRLIATGAAAILLVRPEALVGPSFQMSFAAVASIVTLHGSPRVQSWLHRREEGILPRFGRFVLGLLLTGLAVEAALIPIALFHFHKSGMYGVLANLIAIPMTTFLTMPAEALAILLEPVGISAPFWGFAGWTIDVMLGIADMAANARGALIVHPAISPLAYALALLGGLWIILWRKPVLRRWAAIPIALSAAMILTATRPDLLVTGDGRHAAIVDKEGVPALLRDRTGDYMQMIFKERSAYDGDPAFIAALSSARCSKEACIADVEREGRAWRLLAFRSRNFVRWSEMVAACEDADIVIADRRLPDSCAPRWLKLDRPALERSGGVAIHLGQKVEMDTVARQIGAHPWRQVAEPRPKRPLSSPRSRPQATATPQARFPTDR